MASRPMWQYQCGWAFINTTLFLLASFVWVNIHSLPLPSFIVRVAAIVLLYYLFFIPLSVIEPLFTITWYNEQVRMWSSYQGGERSATEGGLRLGGLTTLLLWGAIALWQAVHAFWPVSVLLILCVGGLWLWAMHDPLLIFPRWQIVVSLGIGTGLNIVGGLVWYDNAWARVLSGTAAFAGYGTCFGIVYASITAVLLPWACASYRITALMRS
jgi:hypothetical protein